jgi:hypothetical protein
MALAYEDWLLLRAGQGPSFAGSDPFSALVFNTWSLRVHKKRVGKRAIERRWYAM